MHIAVVGSGHVGLVAGECFADLGHRIVWVDNEQEKLAALQDGQVPMHEKFLPELLTRHRRQRLKFSDDLQAAALESDRRSIAVGTPPTEQGEADLSYVESVARCIPSARLGFTDSSVGRTAVTPEVRPSPTNAPPLGVENS